MAAVGPLSVGLTDALLRSLASADKRRGEGRGVRGSGGGGGEQEARATRPGDPGWWAASCWKGGGRRELGEGRGRG